MIDSTTEIIRKWLAENRPVEFELKPPYERRFGMEGIFVKYDDAVHAERRNMIPIRETGEQQAFGYCNNKWNGLKSRIQKGDEIWKCGDQGGVVLLVIRDGSPIYKFNENFDPDYCLILSTC